MYSASTIYDNVVIIVYIIMFVHYICTSVGVFVIIIVHTA